MSFLLLYFSMMIFGHSFIFNTYLIISFFYFFSYYHIICLFSIFISLLWCPKIIFFCIFPLFFSCFNQLTITNVQLGLYLFNILFNLKKVSWIICIVRLGLEKIEKQMRKTNKYKITFYLFYIVAENNVEGKLSL